MPSSPPRFQEEKEGGHDSNSSSSSDSRPHTAQRPSSPSDAGEQQKTTIMLMRDGGTRLMSARTVLSGDDGQTTVPPSRIRLPSGTEPTEELVNGLSPKHASLHVDNSASEHKKNDITSMAAGEQEQIKDHAGMREMRHQPATRQPETPTDTESVSPSTSASTGLQQRYHLSQDILQQSIDGAVASVTSSGQPRDSLQSGESNGDRKMSVDNFLPTKKPRRKRKPQVKPGQSTGRWTVAEHRAFLEGLRECGREWKKVALRIPTRTSAQIRSHAQKYFSKLQRDHDSFVNHGDSTNTPAVATGNQQMRPSVQRSVERIMANPDAAQREVENTLEALRERYRQLQLRLEERQRQRSNTNRCQVVEDDDTTSTSRRKRALEEPGFNDQRSTCSIDDQSSVSSAVSASVASMGSSGVAARDLGNEELIALHVLGGDLARGDTSIDDCGEQEDTKSPESSDSSTESESQNIEDSFSPKRQKK